MFNFNIMLLVYFYLAIIVFLIFYDIYTKTVNKRDDRITKKYTKIFKKDIKKEYQRINSINKVSKEHKKKCYKLLLNPKKLLIYEASLKATKYEKEYCEFKPDSKKVRIYKVSYTSKCRKKYYEKMSDVYLKLLNKYLKKEEIYYAYYFDFINDKIPYLKTKEQIIEIIKEYILASSSYTRWNAIKCIYTYGDSNLIYESLSKMNSNNKYYDFHLLADDLLKIKDKKNISKMLVNNFANFNEDYQLGILNYLKRLDIDYKKKVFDIYKTTKSKEVRIAASRYFIKNKYDEIKKYLINILKNKTSDVEEAIVSATVLGSYKDIDTKEILIKSLTSENYYIRKNSAKSLSKFTITEDDENKIINLNDKYALDVAKYYIFKK